MNTPSLKQLDPTELAFLLVPIITHPAFSRIEIEYGDQLTITFGNLEAHWKNARHFRGVGTLPLWYDCLRLAHDWCLAYPNYGADL